MGSESQVNGHCAHTAIALPLAPSLPPCSPSYTQILYPAVPTPTPPPPRRSLSRLLGLSAVVPIWTRRYHNMHHRFSSNACDLLSLDLLIKLLRLCVCGDVKLLKNRRKVPCVIEHMTCDSYLLGA